MAEVAWDGAWILGSWLCIWGLGALTPVRLYSGSLFEGSSTSLFDWKPCWLQPISENGYYITLSLSFHSTTLKIVFSGVAFLFSFNFWYGRDREIRILWPKNESVALSSPQRLRLGFSERVVDDGKGSSPCRRPLRAYFFRLRHKEASEEGVRSCESRSSQRQGRIIMIYFFLA